MTPTRWQRARRWTFNAVTAVSAMASVTLTVAWLVSYWMPLECTLTCEIEGESGRIPDLFNYEIMVQRGLIRTGYGFDARAGKPINWWGTWQLKSITSDATSLSFVAWTNRSWFGYYNRVVNKARPEITIDGVTWVETPTFSIHAPIVVLVLATLILPILRMSRTIHHWRQRRNERLLGLCAKCGYDLRGTPGPACPECGAAITAKTSA